MCRAFLSPYKDENGKFKWWGRFNMGLTSINLADAGLSANKDLNKFWEILDSRLELCKESLLLRYKKLENTSSDVAPILWQYGAIARLNKHEPITKLLQNGYGTITLGYMGVYECVMALIGESNTTQNGKKLALEIVQHLKDKVLEWKAEYKLGFALYGTPAESLTDYFAKTTRKRFGEIKGITDRGYLTNSFHVNVKEKIDAFSKIDYEAQFHNISSGGCVSYIETPNMINNVDAIIELMQYMYENIQYCEFNTKLDNCHVCGYDGEMHYDSELKTWYCPNCGNHDETQLTLVRRTCGYLGENLWNVGRTEEIINRVMHI